MNDRQLRYALAVWREHSFSKAAARLNISQPSVSEQIRLLEDEIGFALFRRRGRGVEVTYKGRTFLHQAERAIADLNDLSATARMLRGGPHGTFRVGFSTGISHAALPLVIAALRPVLDRYRLEVQVATTRRIHRLVFEERLDVGIAFDTDRRGLPPGIERQVLMTVRLGLLAPPSHRLARLGAPVALAVIAGEMLIVNEPDMGFGETLHAAFAKLGAAPAVSAISDSMDSLRDMVAAGAGLAVVPDTLAAAEIEQGRLAMLPIEPQIEIPVTLVRRMGAHAPADEGVIALVSSAWATRPEPMVA